MKEPGKGRNRPGRPVVTKNHNSVIEFGVIAN